tara:strand:+ start:197763 stop:198371 length:609 start_codon:yes stop_codon:yes gene_type:complete
MSDQTQNTLCLTFKAVVQPGEGRFSRMIFPGRDQIEGAPEDWPLATSTEPGHIEPGSLNCVITEFPDDLDSLAGEGDRVAKLDTGMFTPTFSIPRDAIEKNVVAPWDENDNQRKGIAQAWRCVVTNEDTQETFDAWHVRRIDGTYPPFHGILELMADRKLRDAHGLQDGTPITIKMYKGQDDANQQNAKPNNWINKIKNILG